MAEQGGYFSPGYEYSGQLSKIERRKALAKAMQAQSMEPLQGGSAGGYAIPIHPLQGLAKMAQAYAGEKVAERAETQQADLAKQSQGAYQQMLAKALSQMKTDPQGAMATLSTHPQGAALLPLAMQEYQRQQWAKSLMPQQGGQTDAQATLAMGKGPIPVQPGAAGGGQAGPDLNNPAAWITAPEGGRQYLEHTSRQKEALGGVQYDQQGKAFVITKGGGVQYLPGITARDKMDMVPAGDRIVPVNPYQQNQPIPMGMSPADQVKIPMAQQDQQFTQAVKGVELADKGIALPKLPAPPRPGFAQQPVPPMLGQGPAPIPQAPAGPQGAPAALPIPPEQKGVPQQPNIQGKPITPFSPPSRRMSPEQERALAAKRAEEGPKAALGIKSARTKAQTVIGKVDEALKGVNYLTSGIGGSALSYVPGTSAFDLDKTIDTIRANIGFKELADMRAASPTGGALGSVTVRELELLESAVGALSQGQSPAQLKQRLTEIKTHYENWLRAMEEDYTSKYGQPGGGAMKTTPQDTNDNGLTPEEQKEYDALRKKHGR